MSSISEHYSLPAQTKGQRPHTRGDHPSPRPRTRPQVAALQNSGLTPVMGPANHAPGVPIMGRASSGPYLMGGADAGPHVNVMGSGDRAQRVDVFGDSDLSFVDSLFTPVRRRPLTQPANEHEPHVSLRPRGGLGVRDATTY